MAYYSIGEFAKKTGLSIPTLRYYEQEKLIYSHREENNRRYYDDSDIAWTQFIIRLKMYTLLFYKFNLRKSQLQPFNK